MWGSSCMSTSRVFASLLANIFCMPGAKSMMNARTADTHRGMVRAWGIPSPRNGRARMAIIPRATSMYMFSSTRAETAFTALVPFILRKVILPSTIQSFPGM